MIERLPEGISIGWMQAPPQWIFTHTVRFVGVVRVVIQDGEGFILIQKGKPLAYYFKHGRIEMRGHAALDYFNSHPTIEFNLCKYSPEEMAEAMKICSAEEPVSPPPPPPERKAPEIAEIRPAPQPAPQPVTVAPEPVTLKPGPEPAEPVPVQVAPPAPAQPVHEPQPVRQVPRSVPPPPPVFPQESVATDIPPPPPAPSPQVVLDEQTLKVIGQIKKLNGVVAISVFNDTRNILLMGDVEIEPLLKIARNMLATSQKITPLIEWGSFVHMTIQIPEGNVIVAPYQGYHLYLLTTRTINIGHIRRILRDLQITE